MILRQLLFDIKGNKGGLPATHTATSKPSLSYHTQEKRKGERKWEDGCEPFQATQAESQLCFGSQHGERMRRLCYIVS